MLQAATAYACLVIEELKGMAATDPAVATEAVHSPSPPEDSRGAVSVLIIAAAVALLHLATNSQYGFHRDELQFLSDARHLDWGFVAYPPFTPLVERISLALFGVSVLWLRLFSVLAQAGALILTGMIARELGGGRLAQIAAALAVALSPLPLFEGTEFQYSSFDYLWWVLASYCIVRLLKSDDPRWWVAISATVGIGLETKYTMAFFVIGILSGMVITPARRFLGSRWFWTGSLLAMLIFLPNLIWQFRHDFISLHFLQHIHARDVRQGRAKGFVPDQFLICANPFAAPLWLAGLGYLLFAGRVRRYQMLAWMYLVPLALFFFMKARGYYLAAAYPMLFAAGGVIGERWLASLRRLWSRAVSVAYFAGLAFGGAYIVAIIVPLWPPGSASNPALKRNGDLREEIGWDQLVRTVAGIRDGLTPAERASYGIIVSNYGEQGAVEILGPAYDLPAPISMTNSAWLRGYPNPPPTTLIVIGFDKDEADQAFASCRLAGHNGNPYGIHNEESDYHPEIFVCGPPRKPWPEFWDQRYG